MLRSFSNAYLTPDDFSVPCRLRRGEESNHEDSDDDTSLHQLNQPEDMTCTMRKWHRETNAAFASPLRRDASQSGTKVDDAELIFKPAQQVPRQRCMSGELSRVPDTNTPIPLSKRFASFGTMERIGPSDQFPDSGSDNLSKSVHEPQFKEEMTIPVKDIIKVVTRGEDDSKKSKSARRRSTSTSKKEASLKEECRQSPSICITTPSGSYELLMESTNEQLVVLTFLKVNSTKGKVVFVAEADSENNATPQTENCGKTSGEPANMNTKEQSDMKEYESMMVIDQTPSTISHSSSQSNGSFDIEKLTAKTMAQRLEKERVAEKLERRFYRLVSSLDDLSSNFAKCACGCFGDSSVNDTVLIEKEMAPRRRKNTESTVASDIEKLEVDPALSGDSAFMDTEKIPLKPRGKLMKESQMPSGLSVEREEQYLVDKVPCSGGNYYSTMITCDI